MDERRRKLVAEASEEKYRLGMFDYLKDLERRIGDRCANEVASMSGKLDENTLVSAAANANSLEAVNSIKALTKALSATIAIEGAVRATPEVVSAGVVKTSSFSKIVGPILVATAAAAGLWHTYISKWFP